MLKRLAPLLLIIALAGCTEKSEPATPPTADSYTAGELDTSAIAYGPAVPHYTIVANYDETSHRVTGRMTVTFVNNLGEPLDEVLFNVWPNVDEFGGAGADVRDVRVDGQPAEASLEGTVLTVSGVLIAAGATAEVEMDFIVTVPEQQDRFGWSYRQTSLGSWFPTLAVHDNHGWNTPPYFPYGESFYSVTGTFDVTFSAPADLEILATGGEQSRTEDGSTQTVHFTADDVRDFFILLNTPYHTIQEQIGGIEVTVAYRDGEDAAAQTMMETARDVIPRYESWFGHYPWETLTIASADYSSDFDGGMEYPRLVTVNTPHIEDDEELGVTAAHEIAHQWFYSLVGSNPYREPWLDESLTTFASYAAYYDTTDFDWIETVADDYSLTSSVDDFEEDDYDRYGDIMYDGGAKMLSYLHGELGDHAFWNALRAYAVDRKYKIATTADFLRVMQEATDENLKPFFEGHQLFIDETLY